METTAKERVAKAIAEYGRPAWVAATTKADRDALTVLEMRELLKGVPAARTGPTDNRDAILRWAKDNLFAEVTPAAVAEVIGVTAQTAKKIMEERADVFKKIGRGTYEVRDADEDRRFARKQRVPRA